MTGDNDDPDAGDPDEDAGVADPDELTGAGNPADSTDGSGAAGDTDGSDDSDGDRTDANESDAGGNGDAENAGESGGSTDAGDTGRSGGPTDADGSTGPGGSGGPGGPGSPGGAGGSGGAGGEGPDEPYRRDVDPERVEYLASELADLQAELDEVEAQVEDKTVHRDDVEAELRRYVRARQRKGHATGWGPYLVLLYGVVMTLGAFYYLGGVWAILAMLVVWLSTLGLYVFMAVFSTGITVGRRVAALRDTVGRFRD